MALWQLQARPAKLLAGHRILAIAALRRRPFAAHNNGSFLLALAGIRTHTIELSTPCATHLLVEAVRLPRSPATRHTRRSRWPEQAWCGPDGVIAADTTATVGESH